MELMTPQDEFWLYVYPINPINIPSVMVFKRTKMDNTKFYSKILDGLGRKDRCSIKQVKMFSKYFFKRLTEVEYQDWKKTHTGIREDIRTDKELIEFALKLKSLEGKDRTTCSVHVYYIPNFNEDESAILSVGHHSYNDGISQF